MFLNYFDLDSGIPEEESETVNSSRQVRNRIDLLVFAIEKRDSQKVDFYKEKLYEFVRRSSVYFRPMHLEECFHRFQFVYSSLPENYYRLFIDIMRKTKFKFSIRDDRRYGLLDTVPIYIACVGAQISKYEPDLLDEYLDTGL